MPEDSKKSKKAFYVKITSPEGLVFGGDVIYLSSINDTGKFDILPKHSNFITIIKDYVKLQTKDGEDKEFEVHKGIIKCSQNIVDVYLGIEDY